MSVLILKRAKFSRPSGQWQDEDYNEVTQQGIRTATDFGYSASIAVLAAFHGPFASRSMMSRMKTFPSLSSSRQMMMAWKVSGLPGRRICPGTGSEPSASSINARPTLLQQTRTIPIVFAALSDPVHGELVNPRINASALAVL